MCVRIRIRLNASNIGGGIDGKLVNHLCYADVCRANSFKRSISHVEFNKSHVVLRNDVQFSKSTSDLLKTTGTF